MNSSFTNVALYIKRAEEYQTKEYIIKVFAERNIGKVHDVKFIKKIILILLERLMKITMVLLLYLKDGT